jgi:hypothetical protein
MLEQLVLISGTRAVHEITKFFLHASLPPGKEESDNLRRPCGSSRNGLAFHIYFTRKSSIPHKTRHT